MNKRFHPSLVWVAAGVAVAVSIGAALALHVSPKVFAATYFTVFGGLATASTMFTEVRRSTAVGAFGAAAAVFGVVVFLLIRAWARRAGADMGEAGAGAAVGSVAGTIYGIAYFLDALAAGIAGVFFGRSVQHALGRTRTA